MTTKTDTMKKAALQERYNRAHALYVKRRSPDDTLEDLMVIKKELQRESTDPLTAEAGAAAEELPGSC